MNKSVFSIYENFIFYSKKVGVLPFIDNLNKTMKPMNQWKLWKSLKFKIYFSSLVICINSHFKVKFEAEDILDDPQLKKRSKLKSKNSIDF